MDASEAGDFDEQRAGTTGELGAPRADEATPGNEHALPERDAAAPDAVPEDPIAAEARVLLGEIEAELAAVSAALDRLEQGTYGTCVVCGAPLSDEELAADPAIGRCRTHR